MPDSVERKGIQPALLLRGCKFVVVDPFQKVKTHELWLMGSFFMLYEARTALPEIVYEPRRNAALRCDDRLDPECKRLPP